MQERKGTCIPSALDKFTCAQFDAGACCKVLWLKDSSPINKLEMMFQNIRPHCTYHMPVCPQRAELNEQASNDCSMFQTSADPVATRF